MVNQSATKANIKAADIFSTSEGYLLGLKDGFTLKIKQTHQSRSTLKTIQKDANMKGQPQAWDAVQSGTALSFAEEENAHMPFKPVLLPFSKQCSGNAVYVTCALRLRQ